MPTGPKGQKRPADVIGNAVKIMRIATGEEEDTVVDDGKESITKGVKGGAARARKLSAVERERIAKKAATTRWGKARLAQDAEE